MKIYSVATGKIDPFKSMSRKAVRFVTSLDGLFGVRPIDGFTLWFFESEKLARYAKVKMQEKGLEVGTNICEFEANEDLSEVEFVRGV